jgi:hypothetical protein
VSKQKGPITGPAVRDDPPDVADWGMVVRPIGPVGPIIFPPGILHNGIQTAVGAIAVIILPANLIRKAAVIQNVGPATIRIGVIGVTSTTGIQLVPGATAILEMPYCPLDAIYAIEEAGASSVAFATEVV